MLCQLLSIHITMARSLSVIPKSNIAGGVSSGQTFKLHFRMIALHHTQTCNKSRRQRLCHKRSTRPQKNHFFFHPRFRKSVSLDEEKFKPWINEGIQEDNYSQRKFTKTQLSKYQPERNILNKKYIV